MTHRIDTPKEPETREMTPGERRASLIRLLVIVGLGAALSVWAGAFWFLVVVLALILMIMLHELGHFLTAKWGGMKITEYFLGFGPRLWSVRKGETEYGVKAIPAGGYVRILGMSNIEEVDPADEARTYRQQSFPKRMLVAVAGSAMHFLIAFMLLVLLFGAVGVPEPTLTVGEISRLENGPSPAQEAGFRVGDRIVALDGRPAGDWEDVRAYIRARPGDTMTFVVERDGEPVRLAAVPADAAPDGEQVGFLGIGNTTRNERVNPVVAVGRAGESLGRYTVATVASLGAVFGPDRLKNYADQLTAPRGRIEARPGNQDAERPVSVVGATRIAGQAAERQEYVTLIMLLVAINLFVGVFNLFPLLPLDGGHVAIAVYERIRSRRGRRYHADVSKLLPLTVAVVMLLIVLGVTTIYLDVVRPISLQ